MKLAIILATTLSAAVFHPGTTVAKTTVEILDASGNAVATADAANGECSFSGIVAGSYTLRATDRDQDGMILGTPYTEAFVVEAQPIALNLTSGATINVSAD